MLRLISTTLSSIFSEVGSSEPKARTHSADAYARSFVGSFVSADGTWNLLAETLSFVVQDDPTVQQHRKLPACRAAVCRSGVQTLTCNQTETLVC